MQALHSLGGAANAKDIVDFVADELNLPEEIRNAKGVVSGREINLFARRVRWVRQDGIRRQFLSAESYGKWALTESGRTYLQNIRPGFIITIYETALGQALWAECETAAAMIDDKSVNLIITSPEFPLLKPKDYGNRTGQHYLDWLCDLAGQWKRMLVDDGSLVLNVGPVWQRGQPIESVYMERLLLRLIDETGFHLAQRHYFENPGKVPSSEWVTVRRVRVKNVIEPVWWLSKTEHPKANNRRVLLPYTSRMTTLIAKGGQQRGWNRRTPAGHSGTEGGFGRDNGGSIPSNLIKATNSDSCDYYHRMCRLHGIPSHPGRFPKSLPEFFIKLLTDEGDLVYDPMGGSNTTGSVCEELRRRWLISEKSLTYLSGSKFKIPNYRNVAPDLCPI